jgi:S-DNA-T family DNA segregation ATPase FtsK/SpoIIIE
VISSLSCSGREIRCKGKGETEKCVKKIARKENLIKPYFLTNQMIHLQIIDAIQGEVQAMDAHWTGPRPEGIPMMPEVFTFEDFRKMASAKRQIESKKALPLGLDFEDVQSVPWNYQGNLLYGYGKVQQGEAFAKQTLAILKEQTHTVLLLDTGNSSLQAEYEDLNVVATTKEDHIELIRAIEDKLTQRQQEYQKAQANNPALAPQEFTRSIAPIIVILNDFPKIVSGLDPQSQSTLAELYGKGPEKGIYLLTIADAYELGKGYDEASKAAKRSEEAVLRIRLNDQTYMTVNNKSYKEENLKEDEAYSIVGGIAYRIQVGRN